MILDQYDNLNNQFTLKYYLEKTFNNSNIIDYCANNKLDIDYIGFIYYEKESTHYIITTNIERRLDNGYRLISIQQTDNEDIIIDNRQHNINLNINLKSMLIICYNNIKIQITEKYESLDNIYNYLSEKAINKCNIFGTYAENYQANIRYLIDTSNKVETLETYLYNNMDIYFTQEYVQKFKNYKVCFNLAYENKHYIFATNYYDTYLIVIEKGFINYQHSGRFMIDGHVFDLYPFSKNGACVEYLKRNINAEYLNSIIYNISHNIKYNKLDCNIKYNKNENINNIYVISHIKCGSILSILENIGTATFDENFNEQILLPKTLKTASFGYAFNQPLMLTPNLQTLILGPNYTYDIIPTQMLRLLKIGNNVIIGKKN